MYKTSDWHSYSLWSKTLSIYFTSLLSGFMRDKQALTENRNWIGSSTDLNNNVLYFYYMLSWDLFLCLPTGKTAKYCLLLCRGRVYMEAKQLSFTATINFILSAWKAVNILVNILSGKPETRPLPHVSGLYSADSFIKWSCRNWSTKS